MSTVRELESDRAGVVNPTRIVHFAHDCDLHRGLCGASLNGNPRGEPVECHVCADLVLSTPTCPHCGGGLWL